MVGPVKITIFGLTLSSSWGNGHATPYRAILRALHRRGARVVVLRKGRAILRGASRFHLLRLLRPSRLYSAWNEMRTEALREVRESDIVVTASYCPEGARINDEILRTATAPCTSSTIWTLPSRLNRLQAGSAGLLAERPDCCLRSLSLLHGRQGSRSA